MKDHHQILIIGGGTAGLMVSSQLLRQNKKLDVAIIEPADKHYYQPAWTLVGADTYSMEKTARSMGDVLHKDVTWIRSYASAFNPEQNKVVLDDGAEVSYDYLVVAPGIKIDPTLIEGLADILDKDVVCSNYTDPLHTRSVIKNFKGGNALFTQPNTPIKCGGAPQKTAYLAADYFRKNRLADKTNVIFATPGSVIFGVPEIRKTLEKVLVRYNIDFKPFYVPVKVDGEKREVHFKLTAPEDKKQEILNDNPIGEKLSAEGNSIISYDMLHLAPPQTAPDFIRNSPLANEGGWLAVDQGTMQHLKYDNIFGLGDCAGLPTAKTGAAVRKQAPVVVENIQRLMNSKGISDHKYDGYSSCPLVTGYGKMVLAEFDYEGKFTPDPKLKRMLITDSSKELWRLWVLKKHILPWLYWNKIIKGQEV
jgi:sulfide:quinone oxidoreductase